MNTGPDATPELVSDRLRLAPFCRADAADVLEYASNPNVSRYTTWRTHATIADSQAFIEMVLARGADQHCWAIRLRDAAQVIGAIEVDARGKCPGEGSIHYVLAEPHWGRGLMTEAARTVLGWVFDAYPQLQRLVTAAVVQNVGSTRVMEKCGMSLQRIEREQWDKYPEPVELAIYSVTRQQWADRGSIR